LRQASPLFADILRGGRYTRGVQLRASSEHRGCGARRRFAAPVGISAAGSSCEACERTAYAEA
jgi:hypothetical protein